MIATGIIDEESYLVALAKWLGWGYENFEHRTRASCPLSNRQLIDAGSTGLIRLNEHDEIIHVVAPQSVCQLIAETKGRSSPRFRLTTAAKMNAFISRCAAEPLGAQAANDLLLRAPRLSAATRDARALRILVPIAALLLAAALIVPGPTFAMIETVLAGFFLAWLMLRLLICAIPPNNNRKPRPVRDQNLPRYTIIAALYHEAKVVETLLASLDALDYPREKREIIFALEPDDAETLAALERLKSRVPFEIVIAPESGPRTKPKALNAALAFATGTYTVIYDAEDRPEPDQLRRAVEA